MRFLPLHHRDRFVVFNVDERTMPAGGIFISDMAQKKSAHGDVLSVGPRMLAGTNVIAATATKAGHHFLLGKCSGTTEGDFLGLIECNASVRAEA